MADIDDAAMAEPDHARRPMSSVWIEKAQDYLVRYRTRGDDAAMVAVAPEPQQHTRMMLIFLATAGAVFGLFTLFYLEIKYAKDWDYTVDIAIWLCASFAGSLIGVSTLLILDCQDGFQQEDRRFADFLLQL